MTPSDEYVATERPAGVVTRLIASAIDIAGVMMLLVGLYLAVAALLFLWSPSRFSWPSPSLLTSTALGSLLAFCYLTLAWATTGRTYGDSMLGLRVLSRDGRVLHWLPAALRAAACVAFPAGLLWVAVSGRRRSIQDVLLRTVVVYDSHRAPGSVRDRGDHRRS